MSYGLDLDDSFDHFGALVDHVLKGTPPSELPFEEPTRFRFALNLKTAKLIGFEPPASLLASADEISE
jgi:putative ABC transport system substrate-binding protein